MGHSILFTPLAIGGLTFRNRIVMAPLTRMRAGEGHVPTPMNAEYYAQRASARNAAWIWMAMCWCLPHDILEAPRQRQLKAGWSGWVLLATRSRV